MPSDFTNPGFLDWTVRVSVTHGLTGEGMVQHVRRCTLDFTCTSRGIGARVTHIALPRAQSAVTAAYRKDSVVGR